jgi:hypothetical protein
MRFSLWAVLFSVTVGNELFEDTCKMSCSAFCVLSLYIYIFRLETLLHRVEVLWSVVRELHGLRNCRAASLSEVLIVGGLIVTTMARRDEGDCCTALLLKAMCHSSWILVVSRFAESICLVQRLSTITYIALVFICIFNFDIYQNILQLASSYRCRSPSQSRIYLDLPSGCYAHVSSGICPTTSVGLLRL